MYPSIIDTITISYLVLHDEVGLGAAEVEGGLLEVLALVRVGKQERGGHTVGFQVVD